MAVKTCTVNRTLLPLKFTLFFFSAGASAILPYLTIHMKDIGISDIDVALIYTTLPFCTFIAPPLVGFFGDKLGNYARVLQLNLVLCGIFHTLLLFVPKNTIDIQYPASSANLGSSGLTLSWEPCNSTQAYPTLQNRSSAELRLSNCVEHCPGHEVCSLLAPFCSRSESSGAMVLRPLIPNITEVRDGGVDLLLSFRPDPCAHSLLAQKMDLPDNCNLKCQLKSDLIGYCEYTVGEGRLTTNLVYFALRMLATMSLASCFIMLDAQTIQMCSMEEANGKKGAYGRQILYRTLASAIISPLVGLLMDYITKLTGATNYTAPFIIADLLFVCTMVCVCLISKDIGLPKDSDTMNGLRLIFKNLSCIIFLVMMFVCGCMFGFVETFLFVYLKEDLAAPIYLLGLTITTGAVASIPFLYYSDYLVNRFGTVNVIVWALLTYGIRYVGYSYITCAWYAFPFEGLEVFTISLLMVASAKFVKTHAPPGTLGTMTGLSGGAHYGFGKGVGGLVGGVLKDRFNSTAIAFRVFGVAAFVFGSVYAVFHGLYGRKVDRRIMEAKQREADKIIMTPFLEIKKKNIVKDEKK